MWLERLFDKIRAGVRRIFTVTVVVENKFYMLTDNLLHNLP